MKRQILHLTLEIQAVHLSTATFNSIGGRWEITRSDIIYTECTLTAVVECSGMELDCHGLVVGRVLTGFILKRKPGRNGAELIQSSSP